MSRCNSNTTVEIVAGGSCPSRSPSPSVCIVSGTEPRPPSPTVCIVSESSRPPSPTVCVVNEPSRPPSPTVCIVKEEPGMQSFCVARGKRSSSPTTVYVVSEGEAPRRPARSPNVCIVTTSSPQPKTPDLCIVTEERPPSPRVCVVTETRRSPSPTRVEVIETPKLSSSSTIIIEE